MKSDFAEKHQAQRPYLLKALIPFAALILITCLGLPSLITPLHAEQNPTLNDPSQRLQPTSFKQRRRLENLFVSVFKNGMAYQGVTIKVGNEAIKTDRFGKAAFILPADHYQVGFYQNGQRFATDQVDLILQPQAELVLDLSHDGVEAEFDLPLSRYTQTLQQTRIDTPATAKGKLRFQVQELRSQAPISGARLYFSGLSVEAVTNAEGVAEVSLPEHHYAVTIVHPSFIRQVKTDLKVHSGQVIESQMHLVQSNGRLEHYFSAF